MCEYGYKPSAGWYCNVTTHGRRYIYLIYRILSTCSINVMPSKNNFMCADPCCASCMDALDMVSLQVLVPLPENRLMLG